MRVWTGDPSLFVKLVCGIDTREEFVLQRGLGKIVSCIVLGITLLCPTPSLAQEMPAAAPDDKCLSKPALSPISTTQIADMIAHDIPITLNNSVITGDELNLAKRTIGHSFRISDSVVMARLNLVDTVFSDDFDFRNTCVHAVVNAQRAHFNGGLSFVKSILRDPISLYASSLNGSLTFDDTLFLADANFSRARIQDGAYFTRAHFMKGANFIGTLVNRGDSLWAANKILWAPSDWGADDR